jgi:hypothetical protein
MIFSIFTTIRPAWGMALLMAATLGCAGNPLPPQASPDQAREALRTALDAWQKGESIEALAQREPPVYFNDPKCRSSLRLQGYKLVDGHNFHGQSVRLAAVLSLKQEDGQTQDREVGYLVDTSPAIVIVPE